VIGTLASSDWRFSSHGRKIEKAIKLKEEGLPMVIIAEQTWFSHTHAPMWECITLAVSSNKLPIFELA